VVVCHNGLYARVCLEVPDFDGGVCTAREEAGGSGVQLEGGDVAGVPLHDVLCGLRKVDVPLSDAAVHTAREQHIQLCMQLQATHVLAVAEHLSGVESADNELVFLVREFFLEHLQLFDSRAEVRVAIFQVHDFVVEPYDAGPLAFEQALLVFNVFSQDVDVHFILLQLFQKVSRSSVQFVVNKESQN